MKHYHLTIISKNEESIKSFFMFLNNTFKHFNIIKKYFPSNTKKKFLTILKSPHINKKAQEQFESRFFSNQINIYSPKSFQFLVFLKKIKNNLFPSIKIKVNLTTNKKLLSDKKIRVFNPSNFRLDFFNKLLSQTPPLKDTQFYKNQENSLKQAKQFLKILDTYGEISKNMFR